MESFNKKNWERRGFIKTTAALGALAAFGPLVSCGKNSAQTNDNLDEKETAIIVGLQLYTVRELMKKDPQGTLKKIAEIGYKELESAGYANGQYYGMAPKDFKTFINDLGMTMPSGHNPTGRHDPTMEGTLINNWEKACQDAAEAGQSWIVVPYLTDKERDTIDAYKANAELFNTSAEKAKEYGIKFAYHNHDFEFRELEGEIPMDVLIRETDPSLVQFEIDLYWAIVAGYDPLDYFNQHPGRFPLWHVKDLGKGPEGNYTAELGGGSIDFQPFFDQSEKAGMTHYFVEQDQVQKPALESIALSMEYMKGIKMGN